MVMKSRPDTSLHRETAWSARCCVATRLFPLLACTRHCYRKLCQAVAVFPIHYFALRWIADRPRRRRASGLRLPEDPKAGGLNACLTTTLSSCRRY